SSNGSSAPPLRSISTSSPTTASTTSLTTSTQSSAVTSAVCAVSQISDGQPQECISTVSAVSKISDGQPQASTSASTSATASFRGAAGHTLSPPSIFWASPMRWALLLFVNALPV